MLILVGSGVIVFAAIRRLSTAPELESLGFGIAVDRRSPRVVNLVVSSWLFRQARETDSPALEGDAAHLRTDALHVARRARRPRARADHRRGRGSTRSSRSLIAVAIVVTGLRIVARSWRVLVDEALPDDELTRSASAIEAFADRGVVGYHQLRTRRAGARRYVDLHVQFRSGTTLEDAHAIAHELQDAIRGALARRRRADPPRARGPRAARARSWRASVAGASAG